jgi:hypothetical protein
VAHYPFTQLYGLNLYEILFSNYLKSKIKRCFIYEIENITRGWNSKTKKQCENHLLLKDQLYQILFIR